MPRLHSGQYHGLGASMYGAGVLIHYSGSLSAATAVLGTELAGRDRMFAKYTLERAKTIHHLDRVMSHTSSVVSHCGITTKLKFPLAGGDERRFRARTHLSRGWLQLRTHVAVHRLGQLRIHLIRDRHHIGQEQAKINSAQIALQRPKKGHLEYS